MPPLPFSPEPFAELVGRFPAALGHVYDLRKIAQGAIRPGECRANVFDFPDGVHLCFAVVVDPDDVDGWLTLWVSGSIVPRTRCWESALKMARDCLPDPLSFSRLERYWTDRMREEFLIPLAHPTVGERVRGIDLVGWFGPKGIPQWELRRFRR